MMTPAQRAICALNLQQPDQVPTFELEFQLSEEFFGYPLENPLLDPRNRDKVSPRELEQAAYDLADKFARVYGSGNAYDIGGAALSGDPEKDAAPGLDYCIIPVYHPDWGDPGSPVTIAFRRRLREHFGSSRLFGGHADGTFAIPATADDLFDFVEKMMEEPEILLAQADKMARDTIDANKRQKDAGLDVGLLCCDYCFNPGPFMSPAMFDVFITPFLARICQAGRDSGMYMIKHTDGNINPILESLVQAGPHALHSIDPMAGMDIREVKKKYGRRVALCGNVHCAAMQTGTDEEVRASAEYCLKYGKEGGGYIFCTSNVPFKGMPPERYQMVLDIWKQHRDYSVSEF